MQKKYSKLKNKPSYVSIMNRKIYLQKDGKYFGILEQ